MKHRHHLSSWQVYADAFMLLFNWAMILLILTMVFMQSTNKLKKDYHPEGEYMISLKWDKDRNVDLDLWLKTKAVNHNQGADSTVYYRNREISNIALDRDSRGRLTNDYTGDDGKAKARSGNEELIIIRAVMPGTYRTAVAYYYDGESGHADDTGHPEVPYTAQLIKINPEMKVIGEVTGVIEHVKDVRYLFTFEVDEDGSIKIIENPERPFLDEGQVP